MKLIGEGRRGYERHTERISKHLFRLAAECDTSLALEMSCSWPFAAMTSNSPGRYLTLTGRESNKEHRQGRRVCAKMYESFQGCVSILPTPTRAMKPSYVQGSEPLCQSTNYMAFQRPESRFWTMMDYQSLSTPQRLPTWGRPRRTVRKLQHRRL